MGDVASDYTFFVVEHNSPLRDAVDQWREEAKAADKVKRAFADEFGAAGTVSTSWRVMGLLWRDPAKVPADLWVPAKSPTSEGDPYFVPTRKTKEGRAVTKRMHELPICRAGRLSTLAIGQDHVFTGRTGERGGIVIASCTLEIFSGVDVLGVPNVFEKGKPRPYAIPKGGRRLKASEYYAMKEDHEAGELEKKRAKRKKRAA